MKPLPEMREETLLIRTDYSDDAAWKTVLSEAQSMDPDVRAALEFSDERARATGRPTGKPIDQLGTPLHIIDDHEYSSATCEQILSLL